MSDEDFYHSGQRHLQARFQSERIAARLAAFTRTEFTDDDRALIESVPFFFLATADANGQPDCSFKGGPPGFLRVTGASELAFPDYDGNGMFRSLGNIRVNPQVGLLLIAVGPRPHRLRINGTATIAPDDPLLGVTVGAQMIVRVRAHAIFPNCPRYIPHLAVIADSAYTPRAGCAPVEPEWKSFEIFKDEVHPRQPTFRGAPASRDRAQSG